VSVPAKKLEFRVYKQFSGQDNFQTADEILRGSNVVEDIRVGTTGNTEVCSKKIKVNTASNSR
jgi:hypothetical protein